MQLQHKYRVGNRMIPNGMAQFGALWRSLAHFGAWVYTYFSVSRPKKLYRLWDNPEITIQEFGNPAFTIQCVVYALLYSSNIVAGSLLEYC